MNKELKDRVFDVPQNILNKINHTLNGLNGDYFVGVDRARTILNDKKVTYGQLKKIIQDFKTIDKTNDRLRYDLYGGELMDNWAKQYLQGERDLISDRKDSKMRSQNISGVGIGKNSHLKSHSKKPDWLPPTNLVKSNSHKSSISPITSLKLFEQVDRIKKLML